MKVRAELVGSLSKDTHLQPSPDIDVFLLFPPATDRAALERIGVAIGKAILSQPTLRYAEHPYVRGRFARFHFDVVPAYRVASADARLSAVDRTPFHTAYVRKHLRGVGRDEVRLLKRFLHGINCYGAETATGGFSGYLAELLILKHKTFWNLLVALREARAPIAWALAGSAPPLGGDLVFVDPVDPARNAAAAVTRERLEALLRAARAFTAHPSLDFFWPRPMRAESLERLVSRLSHRGVVGLELPAPRVRADAVLPHVRRFADKVARRIEDEGFRLVRHMAEALTRRRLLVLWEHEPIVLPPTFEHRGPPVDEPDHTRRFLAKWQRHPDAVDLPHPVAGHWQVTVRRRARDPVEILAPALPELLKGLELGAKERKRIAWHRGIELARMSGTRLALTKFLHPRDPWDVALT